MKTGLNGSYTDVVLDFTATAVTVLSAVHLFIYVSAVMMDNTASIPLLDKPDDKGLLPSLGPQLISDRHRSGSVLESLHLRWPVSGEPASQFDCPQSSTEGAAQTGRSKHNRGKMADR